MESMWTYEIDIGSDQNMLAPECNLYGREGGNTKAKRRVERCRMREFPGGNEKEREKAGRFSGERAR